jgi:hypothetical protein
MANYLSIGAIFKDETPYLREWLEYHRLVGVERFYPLNNADGPQEAEPVLAPYVEQGLVRHIPYPGVAKQVPGYDFLLEQFGANTRWLAFIDIDEFLYPVETDTVAEVLRDFEDEKSGGLAVNWMVFGSSGLAQRPPIQIEAFRHRPASQFPGGRPPDFSGNRHVKSIVRPPCTLAMKDAHEALYRPDFTAVNEDGRQVVGTVEGPQGGAFRLYLKLSRDRTGLVSIQRAAFESTGSDEVIPYASWLTEHLQGRPFDEVRQLQPADLEQPFMPPKADPPSTNGNGHAPSGIGDSPRAGPGPSPAATVVAALRQALAQV